jgi:hypothetical protein
MYSAIQLLGVLAMSPEQVCPNCPGQVAAAVVTAPVHLAAAAVRGGNGCAGRASHGPRLAVAARAPKGYGCAGTSTQRTEVAAVAPPAPIIPPKPMTAPPVVKKTVATTTTEVPVLAVAAPAREKVDVYRKARVRTHMANRAACPQ